MDKKRIKILVQEAKHSVNILCCFVERHETVPIVMKWPDLMDSLIDEDYITLQHDLSNLICAPLKAIAQSLLQMALDFNVPVELISSWQIQLEDATKEKDPINSKRYLVTIIDSYILYLRKYNIQYPLIGNIND